MMKKLLVMLTAVLAVTALVAGTAAAMDVNHHFGGSWRTRAYATKDFAGDQDDKSGDMQVIDTRIRIQYEADFDDVIDVYTVLEIGDTMWGSQSAGKGYGGVGTDAVSVEVKHMYGEFDWGPTTWKVGAQEEVISRGFIMWDDMYAFDINWDAEAADVKFFWGKLREGYTIDPGTDETEDFDLNIYGLYATFMSGDSLQFVPGLTVATSDDLRADLAGQQEHDSFYLSLDVDYFMDENSSVWFTGIYKFGDEVVDAALNEVDYKAWLLAIGANKWIGDHEVHGQAFYATGDDGSDATEDTTFSFINTNDYYGQSYYWAEILGYGWFDYQVPTGSPADQTNNIWAINLGATYTVTDITSIIFDVWKAELAEEDANGETDLGIEVDVRLSTQIIENLYLDVIGAYLFAGDAVSSDGNNDENPVEGGAYLAVYF